MGLELGIGFVFGLLASAIIMIVVMRRWMLVEVRSPLDVPATLELLMERIRDAGWSSPGTWNLREAAAKKGVEFGRDVTNLSLCRAPYAKRVLDERPEMSAMMPCTFSVYTKEDGNTYVAKLNTGLMGKLMGGDIAKVMGGHVSREEERMLSSLAESRTS